MNADCVIVDANIAFKCLQAGRNFLSEASVQRCLTKAGASARRPYRRRGWAKVPRWVALADPVLVQVGGEVQKLTSVNFSFLSRS